MNILYLHGFGTRFDHNNPKVVALRALGNVVGIDLDYTDDPEFTFEAVIRSIIKNEIDLIVGTSMGGWMASRVGDVVGVPFVAINPALNPAESLKKHIGSHTDFLGREYILDAETVAAYRPFCMEGAGMILLDEGDELFDSHNTKEILNDRFSVHMFEGGSHRFEHMNESLDEILKFINIVSVNYGL